MYPLASTVMAAFSSPRSSVLGRRPAASSRCDPRNSRFSRALQAHDDPVTILRDLKRLGVQVDFDSFLLQDIQDRSRDIFVFVLDEPGSGFKDRDVRPKAAEHLCEFETYVAAPDDDQMFRQ